MPRAVRALLPAVCLLALPCGRAGAAAPPGEPEHVAADERLLKGAKLGVSGPDLLRFLRSRTLSDEVRKKALALLERLGADDFGEREKASAELLALGPVVRPLVERATRSPDLEARRRAERCRDQLVRLAHPGAAAASARLLALRKPPGTAAALLGYLPYAEDAGTADEVRTALAAVALRDRKAEPALVAALADPDPIRRGGAAEALARAGAAAQLPAVRKLLGDREASVRLRAALGLALAREREAVPVLVDLLGELDREQAAPAEEALLRLAGDQAPAASLGADAAGRRKCRDAWAAWWKREGAKVEMARLTAGPATRGLTLVIVFEGSVKVAELDRHGKELWAIKNLSNAVDAHVLPGDRVLIAEHGALKVTERTFDGKVVWERSFRDGPVQCQRLPNGGTFVVTMSGLHEVDRAGKEVYTKAGLGLRAAHKFRDGRIAYVTAGNEYVRLDPSGKVEKRYPVSVTISNGIGGVDFLPDGGVLIGQGHRVMQHDRDGRVVWEAKVANPYCVTRLANGNTLVASTTLRQFLELDRAGKTVRSFKVANTPWLARRR
jgi:hypothetical protein